MRNILAGAVAVVTAVALLALGVMLGSMDSGNGAPSTLLTIAGIVAEAGMLVVLLYACALSGSDPWARVGSGLAIAALTLLMVGDATSVDGARDLGNGLLYGCLILLGLLWWEAHLRLAAFAIVNGIVGFAFLAFAGALGVPGELNFMLLVVWLAALGVDWLRHPWSPAPRIGERPIEPAAARS